MKTFQDHLNKHDALVGKVDLNQSFKEVMEGLKKAREYAEYNLVAFGAKVEITSKSVRPDLPRVGVLKKVHSVVSDATVGLKNTLLYGVEVEGNLLYFSYDEIRMVR